jgi:hypothetical protein
MLQIGIRSQGFNTEPGWAMLVEIEARVSEKNCCQDGQNSSSEQGFDIEPGWAR